MDLISIAIARKIYDESSSAASLDMNYYFCSDGEYNSGGVPTVSDPDDKTFYIVPSSGSNGIYNIYVNKDNSWELFKSVTIDMSKIPVDNTLTLSGKAADAKKVGDEISDLKDDLDRIVDLVPDKAEPQTLTVSPGFFDTDANNVKNTTSQTWKYASINVLNVYKVKINAVEGPIAHAWNFRDSNGNLLSHSTGTEVEVLTNVELSVPNGATELILNAGQRGSGAVACIFYSLADLESKDRVDTLESIINGDLRSLDNWQITKEGIFTETNDIKGLHIWNLGSANTDGSYSASDKRIFSSIRFAEENLLVSISDGTTYRAMIHLYKSINYASPYNNNWAQNELIIPKGYYYRITVARVTENVTINDPVRNDLYEAIGITPYYAVNNLPTQSSAIDSRRKFDSILTTTKNKWLSEFIPYAYNVNGIYFPSNSWMVTDLFPVEPSTEYIASGSLGPLAGIKAAEYDSNRYYLRDLTTSGGVFTTSADCAYVRLSSNDSGIKSAQNKQLEVGNVPTKYVPPYMIKSGITEVKYDLPSYYDSALTNTKNSIYEKLMLAGKNKCAFCFVTDTHWERNQKHSPEIVRYIVENTPIRTVICGGDILTSDVAKQDGINVLKDFQSAFKFLDNRFYGCIGNHDNNNNSWQNTANKLTDNEMYALLFGQSESSFIVWGDYYVYYFDNTAEKTRYIFVDTGRFYKWTHKRIEFVIDALNSLEADWNCVIITHAIYNAPSETEPSSAFISEFLTMLDCFNARTSGSITSASSDDGAIVYDFSNAKTKCKLVIAGHTHIDQTYTTDGGILCLMFDCDAQNTNSGNSATTGTVNEQCVTTIVTDFDANKVYCVRTGRGSDAVYNLMS